MKIRMGQRKIFEEQDRLNKLSKLNDPLERLSNEVDWESFRIIIEGAFPKTNQKKGGRPSFDKVMLFKVLVLQQYYGLSDDRTEFQILDRLSFMRFLGLTISDKVPDSKTIWYFREVLTQKCVIDALFDNLTSRLEAHGLIVNKGKIVDANIVKAPIQRNSRDENEKIKKGEIPEDWSKNKKAQKDTDAAWTKKNNLNYYGYKNHIKTDSESKLITQFQVTPANVHDSEVLEELLDEKDEGQPLWADSAYSSEKHNQMLKKRRIENQISEKGCRNKPLTTEQQENNKIKSKIRSRVEHVFGVQRWTQGVSVVTRIGLRRAVCQITMRNLVYNLTRSIQLMKLQGISVPV